jgi:uncharacterized protein (TIGR02118 family)
MLTRVGAAARRSDMTIQAFQDHWKNAHGPTAGAIPNLTRYVQHHAVIIEGRTVLPYPGFDACSELDFASLEHMDDGFAQAAAMGELKADEDRFVDKTRYTWLLGEVDVRTPRRSVVDPVTLVTWWRAHPASTPERLVATLIDEWEDGIDDMVVGRRLVVARPDWHAGREAQSADVVEVIAFEGVDRAQEFLGGHAQTQGPVLAGIAFGAERHLSRPVVVVAPDGDAIDF